MNEARFASGHRILGMRLLKDIKAMGGPRKGRAAAAAAEAGDDNDDDDAAAAVTGLSPYVCKYAVLHLAAASSQDAATPLLDSGQCEGGGFIPSYNLSHPLSSLRVVVPMSVHTHHTLSRTN